jgi:hypothetical protein
VPRDHTRWHTADRDLLPDLSHPGGRSWTASQYEWHCGEVQTIVAQESPRPWDEIPGVAVIGLIIGVVVIAAAIRYMINKK